MNYIKFEKNQLINLEYSLNKELIRSNRSGSFACTTIIGCNTRKYHGLLICPQPKLDGETHVLLSKVDETIIQREAEFNIGINKYPGTYNPKGHKYIRDFTTNPIPKITFRVGGVILTKEIMLAKHEERILIKYTLVEAHSPTRIRLKPFLAFRNIHRLSKQNIDLNTKYKSIANGIKVKMYEGYSSLYLQLSKKDAEYVHVPDWYKDIEYLQEQNRGYEFKEDLYVPGYFEIDIKKGESIIFSAGTSEKNPATLTRLFNKEQEERIPRNNFENCLINSAEQFFSKTNGDTDVIAGYPWYNRIGRFTFISLPGLTIPLLRPDDFIGVVDTMVSQMKGPFFPETGKKEKTTYDSVDTSLWFFWTLQQYEKKFGTKPEIWEKYSKPIKLILDYYSNNKCPGIMMDEKGLLYTSEERAGHTWMNGHINNKAVTPRYGYVVELNSLWYNALYYASELAKSVDDKKYADKYKSIINSIPKAFMEIFWNNENNCLADFITDEKQNISIRPNQIIACSVKYSPLDEKHKQKVIDACYKQLLTIRGIRTLSPKDPFYKGICKGNHIERNGSMHQGTAWPWLLEHFAISYFEIYKELGLKLIEPIYKGFEQTIEERGIGTMSEIHEGDPPHNACGAISFAPSVAALLRINEMIKKYKKKAKRKSNKIK
ncbi:MAG: glycogen debranching enzyme N-terminal domain-containing protein [Bacteroidota bacterium]